MKTPSGELYALTSLSDIGNYQISLTVSETALIMKLQWHLVVGSIVCG